MWSPGGGGTFVLYMCTLFLQDNIGNVTHVLISHVAHSQILYF